MKPKFFKAVREVTLPNGKDKRVVLVVGKWQKHKYQIDNSTLTKDGGLMIKCETAYSYRLTIEKAICHPDDEFNEEIGMQIITRRLKRKPTDFRRVLSADDYTMLTPDACQALVDNKANYIVANIEKFIPTE